MKNTTKQLILVIGIAISSSILTIMVGLVCMYIYVIQPFQKDAVDRGFAVWEVTDNATGTTKFTWNEFAQAMHPDNPDNLFAQIEEPLPEVKKTKN
jgi:hypothetical protein